MSLEKVKLAVEEFEAVRVKDLEGLEQERVTAKMNASQSALHRILQSARRKIAGSLVHGKAIVIEGGDCVVRERERLFQCYDCQNE
jgi:predicted DNA-binding protein (UPF0251 family)